MGHIQGTDYVGSMVVMEDGLAKKSEYRRFKVKDVPGNDDFAAMEEVLTRRLTAFLAERDRPVGERPRKFAYPPKLLLVDGGKGQLGVAIDVVEELGLAEEIPVAALAKQFEEVYVPGRAEPIRIPRHVRVAVPAPAHPRRGPPLRQHLPPPAAGQADDPSVLDDIPGLGATRRSGWSRSWAASLRSRPRHSQTWWR